MSRGYHNYRGRRNVGKTLLAAVLVLVIIASALFIFLQERILFFDENGTAYFRLFGEEENREQPAEEVDLTIQPPKEEKPQTTRVVRGFNAPVPLDRENWSLTARQAREELGESWNAVAVTLKDSGGSIYFDSANALPGTVRFWEEDTDVALEAVLSSSVHAVARISCFHDPQAANSETESMGLMNTGGFVFYDGNNSQWLDPAKSAAREYLCALAAEAAELGFDEILLTDVSYPTEGNLDKIAYGEGDRQENLLQFLTQMRETLEPYSVALSVELPESVILAGYDEDAGVTLSRVAPLVDGIYVSTTPSQVHILANAVKKTGSTDFVPQLETYSEGVTGNCLIY